MKSYFTLIGLLTLSLLTQAQSNVGVCSGQNVNLSVANGTLDGNAVWRWYDNAACTGTPKLGMAETDKCIGYIRSLQVLGLQTG
ncbi:MAG: hypothetical protein LBK47_05570 [Prevotellaceae bacterium]|jgi:hypothetical protein|nr:hypothetical protein [Prevotellaceae bacterium]